MPWNRKLFFKVRVSLLLAILAAVLLWAWHDSWDRRRRNEWREPLLVGLIVLAHGDVGRVALSALKERVPALEQRLAEEYERHSGKKGRPFHFVAFGPLHIDEPPPKDPGPAFWELARHTYQRWTYLRAIDKRLAVPTRGLDSRIYVVATPPQSDALFVEGMSEQNGRVGIASVDLDLTMIDLALFVATHELLHTLGATDKYDAAGNAIFPSGLAEPDRSPLYPQRFAEIMARNRPLDARLEVPPESLAELAVGRATAREIGWIATLP